MKKLILYIHGKGGTAAEAEHYKTLFPNDDVLGLDYQAQTPWQAKLEFPTALEKLAESKRAMILIANSIGAYFSMCALPQAQIERAYFISPIVDMERLILDMMGWAQVSEAELCEKRQVETSFGETLAWEYLRYVRSHPVCWQVPTQILYGERDRLTSRETITAFAGAHHAGLTIMPSGEHWFHTEGQMAFLDRWISEKEG